MEVLIVEGRTPTDTYYLHKPRIKSYKVVLYLHHAATLGYEDTVIREPPGADRFVILLHHAYSIKSIVYLDAGSEKSVNIKLSDLADSLGEECCVTLLGHCIFSRRIAPAPLRARSG